MKPNFALSLSFEGIRLLHRAAGGWRIVGDVALDAGDLAAELAVLRRTATALEPGGLRTKLLLPAEQVKFLTIGTEGLDDDARHNAARIALDEATPYAVDDLAFDISADGPNTHIAAVARETLAEAEGFAMEHRFHPVSFATIPGENAYLGEPFFGPTAAAAAMLAPGEQVEPDGIAVVVIGDVEAAGDEGPVVAVEEDAPVAETAEEEATVGQALEETTADDEVSEPVASEPEPDVEVPAVSTETQPEPVAAEAVAAPEPEVAAIDDGDVPAEAAAEEASPVADATPETESLDTDAENLPEAVAASEPEAAAEPEPEPEPEPEAATKLEPVKTQEPKAKPEPVAASEAIKEDTTVMEAEPTQADTETKEAKPVEATIPVMPSLGAASRAVPAASGVPAAPAAEPPSGFASRRGAEPAPGRREPVVTSPALPAEPSDIAPDAVSVSSGTVPPAAPHVPAPDSASLTQAEPAPATLSFARAAPIGRFLSRRKARLAAAPAAAVAPAALNQPVPRTEAERMTVFGARRDIGGKPRFLGLILTAALLVFLAGVAAWASVFLDDGLNLSRLFGEREPRAEAAATPAAPPAVVSLPEEQPAGIVTASLSPALTEEDTAVLDALRDPVPPEATTRTPEEVESSYATSGIWPIAPEVPPEPAALISVDDLYVTSIDPVSTATDAVALPQLASFATDLPLGTVTAPAAAGTVFALDGNGLVIPTAQGALSPDGYTVFLGRPDVVPPPTPARFQPVRTDSAAQTALAAFRPKLRPGDLSESNERANLDGLTRSELAGLRPRLRPRSVQQQAETAAATAAAEETATVDTSEAVETALATPDAPANPFLTATRLATKASTRPDTRPRNFARTVKRAQRTPKPQAETQVASTRTVAPRVVTPKIPSKTSVAKQATVRNAINLRKVNLIGVYGKPSNRRALVRLANGRYKKVVVGDRIDGGRVSAIGDSELRYNKRGRNVVLKMPRS